MTHEETLLAMLRTHGPALRRIARGYAGPAGEEEDLYQEILLQVWRGLPSFRGDAAPGTWLYRVALNTALSWRRRDARRPPHHAGTTDPPAGPGGARSEAAILEEFLANLRPVDRSVLLCYMEGLSYQDVADVTGLSAANVGVRLHRMKQVFTRRYVEH